MTTRCFRGLLAARMGAKLAVCVDLSGFPKIPADVRDGWGLSRENMIAFNRKIVEATQDVAVAFKLNLKFYVAGRITGSLMLRETIKFIHAVAPQVPVILDGKFSDIGSTNVGYVGFALDDMGADAMTLHRFFGQEELKPFLARKDKGFFVLCPTSNQGTGEFQDVPVQTDWVPKGTMSVYKYVAMKVAEDWNKGGGNCGLVVGATCPQELAQVRQIVGEDMPLLILGTGNQGQELEAIVRAGKGNMIINPPWDTIFLSSGSYFPQARVEVAEVAKKLHKLHNDIQAVLAAAK